MAHKLRHVLLSSVILLASLFAVGPLERSQIARETTTRIVPSPAVSGAGGLREVMANTVSDDIFPFNDAVLALDSVTTTWVVTSRLSSMI
jgi:hypothetical protein